MKLNVNQIPDYREYYWSGDKENMKACYEAGYYQAIKDRHYADHGKQLKPEEYSLYIDSFEWIGDGEDKT